MREKDKRGILEIKLKQGRRWHNSPQRKLNNYTYTILPSKEKDTVCSLYKQRNNIWKNVV